LVDRLATYIQDPVVRLRFLKAVAPVAATPARLRQIRRFYLLTAIVLAAALAVLIPAVSLSRLRASVPAQNRPAPVRPAVRPIIKMREAVDVWLVEKTGKSETYSNGLRIDNRFLVTTHPRSYLAFPADGSQPVRRAEPVGMVFHTTESQQASFEASENPVLKRIGESLLEYVRRRRAYNFVIDRFGRVYRVVAEDEAANHSGYSAWADENWCYVNLNESFLGISFEAVSPPAQRDAEISPAQVRSAAMLIEMLRHRYHIPALNCVTHAQISVNPGNMRVGFHLDWASGFPFEATGLPDNDASALPSLWAFGFDYDSNLTSRVGTRMRAGIEGGEALLERRAAAAGLPVREYKKGLRRRYREMLSEVGHARPDGTDLD
jgi:hypothetical protein